MLASTVTLAASPHLKGGPNAEPAFTDLGLPLRVIGSLAGLGNENLVVTVVATGDVTSTCTSPGGNQAPGQNPAEVDVSGTQSIPAPEIKNGNVTFTVTTEAPESPIPGAPGCPNPNWTQEITDVAYTSATITVEQPAGTTVLTITCTFDPPTSDGPVSAADVSCTQS